jgi:hypothetical protein
MPEFDDPRVLVIVQGRFANTAAPLSTPVTFWVPRGAQINQMAEMEQSTGTLKPHAFDAQPDPNDQRRTWVTYPLGSPHFFYEYYYDPLEGKPDKQFTFAWACPYAVDQLLLEIQEPLAATRFTLDPTATIVRFDERFEMTYHQSNHQNLTPGETISVAVRYTKADLAPSLTREEVMTLMSPEAPKQVTTTTHSSPGSWQNWIFALVGGGALALVGALIWHRRQPGVEETVSEHQRGLESCLRCKATLKSNARFCHVCGTSCEDVLQ